MDYIRAAEVLPQELIEQLQQYVDGAAVYIPKKEEGKKAWGKGPAQRQNLQKGMREYIRSICQADRLRNWQRSIFWRKRVSSVLYGRSAKSYRLQFLNALSISDSSSAENFRNSFGVIPVIWRN